TPMCRGLETVRQLAHTWVNEHPSSFPPVVLHITDGGSTDGDPIPFGRAITSLQTHDGSILLFNCHLSSESSVRIEYPNDIGQLPERRAQALFELSSILPDKFTDAARDIGLTLNAGARGLVYNADATSLVQFFEIGTRPANLR